MYTKGITKPLWPYSLNVDSPQAQGLIFWEAGDPSDSKNLFDLSGRGNHGTINGTIPASGIWVPGIDGGKSANVYDGSTNYIATQFAAVTTTPFTVALWATPTSGAGGGVLWGALSKTTNNWDGFYLAQGSSVFSAVTVSNNNFSATANDPTTLVSGQTYLVVAVFASATSRTIYVNVDSGTANTTSATPIGTPGTSTLGASNRQSSVDNFYSGKIEDVRIWKRTLNRTEILSLYDPETRWQLRRKPSKTIYFPGPSAAPVVTNWQPYAIKQMPPQPEPDYDSTLRTKPATGALFHSYSTIDNWRPTAIKQTAPEAPYEPGWTQGVKSPAGALYHSYSVPQNWLPLTIRQTQPEVEREPTWTLAPKQEAGALFPGFTGPVVAPWFPLRSRPQPIPAIEFAPSQGLDEKAKNLFPGFPGFRAFPFLVTFETDAAKASVRTRRHEQYVAGIINSLLLQGIIVEVTPGVWKIVPK